MRVTEGNEGMRGPSRHHATEPRIFSSRQCGPVVDPSAALPYQQVHN